jgi:hypothetical protein
MKPGSFLLIFFLLCHICQAQIRMSYSIGCIGNTNMQTPISSGAVVIDGKACFVLSSGIKIFGERKKGLFTNSCAVPSAFAVTKVTLRAYPNPVVSVVTIQSVERLFSTDLLQAVVYDLNGRRLKMVSVDAKQLSTGFKVDLHELGNGIYIVKIISQRISGEFKLIKID